MNSYFELHDSGEVEGLKSELVPSEVEERILLPFVQNNEVGFLFFGVFFCAFCSTFAIHANGCAFPGLSEA